MQSHSDVVCVWFRYWCDDQPCQSAERVLFDYHQQSRWFTGRSGAHFYHHHHHHHHHHQHTDGSPPLWEIILARGAGGGWGISKCPGV
jgi:hypothetical protein